MSALCAGGIVRHGALCYTARRICAALRAAMTAKNFRTRAAAKRRGISFAPQKYFFMQSAQGIPTQGFQNHIPARGRKLSTSKQCPKSLIFQNHIPARGRKRKKVINLIAQLLNFKTISPQGDGNRDGHSKLTDIRISKPYPRKGTETLKIIPVRHPCIHFKTISPQGDGNYLMMLPRRKP